MNTYRYPEGERRVRRPNDRGEWECRGCDWRPRRAFGDRPYGGYPRSYCRDCEADLAARYRDERQREMAA